MSKYISINYQCGACQKQYEFSVNNNVRGIKQHQCKHFLLKFISNLDYNTLRYMVTIKCLKCNNKQENELNIANNQSMKDYNSKNFQCCQNQISIAVFYSDQKLESINNINGFVPNIVNNNMNNFNVNNFNNGNNMNNLNQMSNINQINYNCRDMNMNNNIFANQNMNNMNIGQNFNNMNNQNMNMMNNSVSDINMGQNMQFMNNNGMYNFQNNPGINNINQLSNIGSVGINTLNSYAYLHGGHMVLGQTINFKFEFKQNLYPVNNVKNNRIFNEVLNEFLNNNPHIRNNLSQYQRYSVSGNIIDVNLTLYENEIRENSIVSILWTGDN